MIVLALVLLVDVLEVLMEELMEVLVLVVCGAGRGRNFADADIIMVAMKASQSAAGTATKKRRKTPMPNRQDEDDTRMVSDWPLRIKMGLKPPLSQRANAKSPARPNSRQHSIHDSTTLPSSNKNGNKACRSSSKSPTPQAGTPFPEGNDGPSGTSSSIPSGLMPGHLSRAQSLTPIIARYAAHGEDSYCKATLSIQPAPPARFEMICHGGAAIPSSRWQPRCQDLLRRPTYQQSS